MKNKLLYGSTFFLLFTVFQTNLCFSAATSKPPAVRDVAGRELRGADIRGGISYYILPAIIVGPDLAGGVSKSNDTCPPQVIQENNEFNDGIKVYFTNTDMKKGVIRTSSDINIRFADATSCSTSLVWRLHELDALTGKYYVSVGGVLGNPGPQTVSNWFKIEKYKLAYKLRFCPSVCKFCKVICRDIGIFKDKNGKRRLALSDVPFEVVFKT